MPAKTRRPKPLKGQLSLFEPPRGRAETDAQRQKRLRREEHVRAVKACFGWWNGRGRGIG